MKINKIIYSPIIPVALTVVLLIIGFRYGDVVSQRQNNNVDSANLISASTATPIISFLNMVQPDKDRIDEIVTGVTEDPALATKEMKQELETLFAKYNMTDEDIEFFKLAGPGFIWANYDVLFFADALESFKKGAPIKSEARANLEEAALIFETMTADIIKNSDQEIEKITKKEPALNPPDILTENDIEGLLNYSKIRLSKLDALMEGVSSLTDTGDQLCDNYKDIKDFEKSIPIVWTAEYTGCLTDCEGAHFTRLPDNVKYEYPRFAAYMRNGTVPDKFKENGLTLKIYGEWTGIGADHPNTVFEGQCVPLIDIDKIVVVK